MSELKSSTIKKNLIFTISAQLFSLIIGLIKTFIIPDFLSIESYGYWQIYLFYTAYVGLFAFGFNDGIYLIYSKNSYDELANPKIRSSFRLFIFWLTFISLALFFVTFFISDTEKSFIFKIVAGNILVMGIHGLVLQVLQITNLIKKYSFFVTLDKILIMAFILIMFFINADNYKLLICLDLLSKVIVVILMIFSLRKLFFGKGVNFNIAFKEVINDSKIGISLMLANLMGMLVNGIGKLIVEYFGNIEEYAYFSFSISVTNLILVFVTAISLVVYPTLKRVDEKLYPLVYKKFSKILTLIGVYILISYFPAVFIVKVFLKDYIPIIDFLNIMFALTIVQGRIQIINNVYFKILRKEKLLLYVNLIAVIIFGVIGLGLFMINKSINLLALATFISMAILCYGSGIYFCKKFKIKDWHNMIEELLFLIGFILLTYLIKYEISAIIYVGILIVYTIIKRKEILNIINLLIGKKTFENIED